MPKFRVRPALKRDGGRMRGVFEIVLPGGMLYDRCMSIDQGMDRIARLLRIWLR